MTCPQIKQFYSNLQSYATLTKENHKSRNSSINNRLGIEFILSRSKMIVYPIIFLLVPLLYVPFISAHCCHSCIWQLDENRGQRKGCSLDCSSTLIGDGTCSKYGGQVLKNVILRVFYLFETNRYQDNTNQIQSRHFTFILFFQFSPIAQKIKANAMFSGAIAKSHAFVNTNAPCLDIHQLEVR